MKLLIKSALVLFVPLYFAAGCVGVKYYGKEYPETKYVRLYFDKSFVPKEKYEIMGEAYLTAPEGYTCREIDEKLISKGKRVGADAIMITSVKKVEIGEYTEPSMSGSGPDAPSLDAVPAQVDGSPVSYDDFDNAASGQRPLVYEYETKLRAVFFKEKAIDLKADALARDSEGVKVKDIIESEQAEDLNKVKTLVEDADKKDSKTMPVTNANEIKDDSQEQLNTRNKADNLKMDN
ncbi:MAG: hypothetical protein A2017_10430 [Lentisphaerae bacterium GWF2_44_16]|nr:MAG: hypothetical protein A2017_10430 [Lentisphaerae bacterium GWF2_44_16]